MYKKIRYAFRYLLAFLTKYKYQVRALILLGLLGVLFTTKLQHYLPVVRSTKRIAIVGRYSLTDLPLSIQQQISIGLTSIDSSGLPEPAASLYWEATDSGKTYIFHLNPQLHWQDGKSLTSSDIGYRFPDAQIEHTAASQFVVHLPDPYAPFPVLASRPLLRIIKSTGIFPHYQVYGLGSYRITSYKDNGGYLETISLSPANAASHQPNLKYYFYPSQQLARTAYKLGLVKTVLDLQEPGDLEDWPNSQITSQPVYDRYVALFFNTQDPVFAGASGKTLRLALSYAVNKDRWPDRAVGPIIPTSWAFNPDVKRYEQDMDKAAALLKKVEKVPAKITITTVPAYLKIIDSIKSDWAALGIEVDIKVVPDVPPEFQTLLIAQAIPNDPDQYNLWHSTRPSGNLTQLKNPRIDKYLEDGRKSLDLTDRKQIYQDFQKYLIEEAPAIFLFYPQTYTITRK